MKLTFLGAARFVTGSCYLLEASGLKILIDCGLAQGQDAKICGNTFPFDPKTIDYVLLTHAHIDHSGRLPQLVKEGFKGSIFTTSATSMLCSIMLLDSASIQESENEWVNRKRERKGEKPIEPLYTKEDAYKTLELFCESEYGKLLTLNENIKIRFIDAGHLLGSSEIELFITEGGKEKKIVFSGDIGNINQPIINDPMYIKNSDVVIMESTYGDRCHEKKDTDDINKRAEVLAKIVDEAFSKNGRVIIPSFAVGRTQELLYLFKIIEDKKLLAKSVPVYLDSPLSIKATSVFKSCTAENYFDKEAMEIIKRSENPFDFPNLHKVKDVQESMKLNTIKESIVIISSSGMCEGGRIKHHLKHGLYKKENTILFVGYQANGTLGRLIVDGAKHVTIFGEQVEVHASIRSLPGLSGHADHDGLIKWITSFKTKPEKIFITHGDLNVAPAFARELVEKYNLKAYAPHLGQCFDLDDVIPYQEKELYIDENDKILNESRNLLAEGLDRVDEVVNRLNDAARKADREDKKTCIRLANAIKRLSSDLDDLAAKWNNC